jgi:ankyrin repeat protein
MQHYLHGTKKDVATVLNPKTRDIIGGPHRAGTPLAIAATNGNVQLMQILIQNGACDGGDIMQRAIGKNQGKVVLALLDAGVPVDSLGNTGESALSNAVSKSRSEIVQLLLDRDANIDVADSSQLSGTVMITAALANDVCIITALLRAGADPCKGSLSYNSPLEAAADKGHTNVVDALLDNELVTKDLDMINVALNIAAGKGRGDVAKSLLKAHANPDQVIDNCNSLEAAANNGNQELVRILYPVIADKKGETLDAYLSRAQQAASPNEEQSENDMPALTDSDPDSDHESISSVTDALTESLGEDDLKGWADRMDKRNRWIRRDTFPAGGTDALSAHVTHKSISSMGIYDDDRNSD